MGRRGPQKGEGGRPKGGKKFGGRKKGTPNKITLDIINALEEAGLSPIRLIEKNIAKLTPNQRTQVALELAQYAFPRRKPVDSLGDAHEKVKAHVTYVTEWGNNTEPTDEDA